MKRSPKLMKLILLAVKNSKTPLSPQDLRIQGYSKAKISDHVHVLIVTEHLNGIVKEKTDGPLEFEIVEGITERGLDYLINADQIINEQMLVQYLNRRPRVRFRICIQKSLLLMIWDMTTHFNFSTSSLS